MVVSRESRIGLLIFFCGRIASVVHHRDGTRAVTDGPYIETKEHLGGFYVITAADLDEALEWADRTSATVGMPIEVRPFAGFSEEPHRSQ